MYDGLLSVRDIATARFTGEFAFLSACKTASAVARLPDEAMSLASALHHTGFQHVVATQWSVYDAVALEMLAAVLPTGHVDGGSCPTGLRSPCMTRLRKYGTPILAAPASGLPTFTIGP